MIMRMKRTMVMLPENTRGNERKREREKEREK